MCHHSELNRLKTLEDVTVIDRLQNGPSRASPEPLTLIPLGWNPLVNSR